MKASYLVFMSCAMLALLCLPAHAQKQGTIPRIGIVRAGAPRPGGAPDLFVEGLRGLGYIEGKNISFESVMPRAVEIVYGNSRQN